MQDSVGLTSPAPFFVGIAGGSCSGKTTIAHGLAGGLGAERVAILQQDAYYRDRSALPPATRAEVDYDAPDAFDHVLFLEHVLALRDGRPVFPPRYCFVTHRRIGVGDRVAPAEVVVLEGLLVLAEPAVREVLDLKVYVDAPDAIRLGRRVARDTSERGRTSEAVLAQFEATVCPAHRTWIEPTRDSADIVLVNLGSAAAAVERLVRAVRARLLARAGIPAVREGRSA